MRSGVPLAASLVAVLFLSCRSTHQERVSDAQLQIPASQTGVSIPPSMCRLVATVTGIDSLLTPSSAGDPCSKAPCQATVRVDSVLGYGSAFPYPLTPGETVRVRFAFTLGPTATILPSVSPAYPGLSIGSRFKADMEGTPAPGRTAGAAVFVVEGYEVR